MGKLWPLLGGRLSLKYVHSRQLDTSAEHLRYGRNSEKTLALQNADGIETELTSSQQRLV